MGLFEWLIWLFNTALAAAVSYYITEWLKKKKWSWVSGKDRRRYVIMVVIFIITFIVGSLIVSPKTRDTARAVLTGDRCYFSSITAPDGANREEDAESYPVSLPLNTPITWEPNNCIMVVQGYKSHVLFQELKGQRSNEIVVQDVAYYYGIYEIKIFRAGYYTESDKIWIEVVSP